MEHDRALLYFRLQHAKALHHLLPQREDILVQIQDQLKAMGFSIFVRQMLLHCIEQSFDTKKNTNFKIPTTIVKTKAIQSWCWTLLLKRNTKLKMNPWQKGCPGIVPGLAAIPIWKNAVFAWMETLIAAYPVIKKECLALKGKKGFQPYRAPRYGFKHTG